MDEIICHTTYLPEGEARLIDFMELLLDDNWADGIMECPESVYSDVGDVNHKLSAKQTYEFLLRAVLKYPFRAIGKANIYMEDSLLKTGEQIWEEYRTDCYVAGKYQKELLASGYYTDALKGLMEKALECPEPDEAIMWLDKMLSHASEYYVIDDDTRPILIYQDNDFCRHVPASFASGLASALRNCRQQVMIWDVSDSESELVQLAGQRFKAVIGIQTHIFLSKVQTGYFHDLISGSKYNIILDHPIGLRNLFENPPDNYYALVHDRNYQRFIKRYWPKVKDCYWFSAGGIQPDVPLLKWEVSGKCVNWREVKKYDVVFIGSYHNYRDFLELLYGFHGPYRRLVARFLHIMRWNTDYPAEKALKQTLEYYGIHAGESDFLNLMEIFRYAISCISSYYREKIIRTLLDAGIELHVYGGNWDNSPFAENKSLICHPGIEMEDSLYIMEQARISLNIMTWHKDGFTERILNSMLAGAVALSDKSIRLEEEFLNGDDIILFELRQIYRLPVRVRELLADDEKLREIAENGRKKVIDRHLWSNRAKMLLEIISDGH